MCGYPPFDGENDYEVADCITNDLLEFEPEDWNHVSKPTQNLVKKLLSKNPKHRANCNDIIKNVWKVEVSHSGFKKAHNKLKQTVLKRKFGQRASFDDNNVKLSHEQSKKRSHHKHEKESKRRKKKSHDDMSFNKAHSRKKNSDLTEQIKAQKQDKEQDAFRGRLGSKGTEHLFLEHMHPMNYRDSFTRNEISDNWTAKKEERERTKKRRNSKSKSKSVNHMQTVTEAEDEEDEPSLNYKHHHHK